MFFTSTDRASTIPSNIRRVAGDFRVAIWCSLVSTLHCPLPPPSDWWGVLSDSRTVSTVVWSSHVVCLAFLFICLSDMRGRSLLFFFFFWSCFFFFPPLRSDRGRLCYFFLSFSSFICFLGCSDGMEREACVCDHGFERSDLCAEIIIIRGCQSGSWSAGQKKIRRISPKLQREYENKNKTKTKQKRQKERNNNTKHRLSRSTPVAQ